MIWSGLDDRLTPAAQWLFDLATRLGWVPVVTSIKRSTAHQAELYNAPGATQVCPPGHSAHELGLAFDLVVSYGKSSAQQQWLGAVWQYIGGAWDPRDPVHFTVGKVGCL